MNDQPIEQVANENVVHVTGLLQVRNIRTRVVSFIRPSLTRGGQVFYVPEGYMVYYNTFDINAVPMPEIIYVGATTTRADPVPEVTFTNTFTTAETTPTRVHYDPPPVEKQTPEQQKNKFWRGDSAL